VIIQGVTIEGVDCSFLFNFTDGKNISSVKLGYVNKPGEATYCYSGQGLKMGYLHCINGDIRWVNNNAGCYPNMGILKNFTVEDYEVFQVTKK